MNGRNAMTVAACPSAALRGARVGGVERRLDVRAAAFSLPPCVPASAPRVQAARRRLGADQLRAHRVARLRPGSRPWRRSARRSSRQRQQIARCACGCCGRIAQQHRLALARRAAIRRWLAGPAACRARHGRQRRRLFGTAAASDWPTAGRGAATSRCARPCGISQSSCTACRLLTPARPLRGRLAEALGEQRMVLAQVGAHDQRAVAARQRGDRHAQPARLPPARGLAKSAWRRRWSMFAAQAAHQLAASRCSSSTVAVRDPSAPMAAGPCSIGDVPEAGRRATYSSAVSSRRSSTGRPA